VRSIVNLGAVVLFLGAIMTLGGCGGPLLQPTNPGATPGMHTRAPYASALAEARLALSERLQIAPSELRLVTAEAANWPDACLAAGSPGESCEATPTSGYTFNLEARGLEFAMRAAWDGSVVRMLTEPRADMVMARVLAAEQHLDPATVRVLALEPMEWPDGCLGAARPGEICTQAVSPGYRVVLEAGGRRYHYHTDATGNNYRRTVAPVAPSEVWIEWASPAGSVCRVAQLGPSTVASGLCGKQSFTSEYSESSGRSAQLAALIDGYAPFRATTPAGVVLVRGRGARVAAAEEQRQVAEWAAQVAAEAAAGRDLPLTPPALSWRRGVTGGRCDALEIYPWGEARASRCDLDEPEGLGRRQLTASELRLVYGWLDSLRPLDERFGRAETGEALVLAGRGASDPSPERVTEIRDFAATTFDTWAVGTPVSYVLAETDLALRTGPGEGFAETGRVAAGETIVVTGAAPAGGWWRVVCPGNTEGSCWAPDDPGLTRPTGAPGEAEALAANEAGIYAAAIRQVYTLDHTFAAAPNFPVIYLQRLDDAESGPGPVAGAPVTVDPLVKQAVEDALKDLPARFVWVMELSELPTDEHGTIMDDGALISFGNPSPQPDGKLHLAAAIYVGKLIAGGQTYIIERTGDRWTVTGVAGPRWIS
jgi:hypothetical protein